MAPIYHWLTIKRIWRDGYNHLLELQQVLLDENGKLMEHFQQCKSPGREIVSKL